MDSPKIAFCQIDPSNLDDPDFCGLERELNISGRFLVPLWYAFSSVQCATFMCVTDDAKERFKAWLKTGDDKEAWS